MFLVAGGVYHVYNRIGRGEVLGVEGYGLTVRELAATLEKLPMACRMRLRGKSGAGWMMSASGVSSGS